MQLPVAVSLIQVTTYIVWQVEKTLEILKLLDKPSPPVITVLGPRSVYVTWSEVTTKSGLPVFYKLLEGE